MKILFISFFLSTSSSVSSDLKKKTEKIVKGKPNPWLRKDLSQLMNQRDQPLPKARKTKSQDNFERYKKL